MNVAAVDGVVPILREVEAGLTLPIPDRVRILRELEFDLEHLTARLEADGLPSDEALRRAREALVPDEHSLLALQRLHAPLYRRMTRRIAGDRLRVAERWALALTSAAVVVVGTAALLRADLLSDPSPFLWPVMGLGGMLFAAVVAKGFQLWVKRDHAVPARGLGTILMVAGATLATGILGVMLDFYRLAGDLEREPDFVQALAPQWLVRDAALLSVSILLALAGGLAWFVLARWVTLIESDHRDVLGLNHTRPSKGDTRND